MKRILIILFLLFCLGSLGNRLYVDNLDFLNLTDEQANIQWIIAIIRDVGFWLFSSLAVIYSIYNMNIERNDRTRLYVFLSIAFSLLWCAIPTYTYIKLSQIPSVRYDLFKERPDFYEDYQNLLDDSDKSKDELIKTTSMIASAIYRDTGVIVSIIGEEGKKVEFVPLEDDKKTYRDLVNTENLMNHNIKSMKIASITNWSVLIFSIFIGVYITYRRTSK